MDEYPIFSPELERASSTAIKQVAADEGASVPPYKLVHGFVARTPKRKRLSLDDEDLQEAQLRYCLFSEPIRIKRLTLKLPPPPPTPLPRPVTTPTTAAAFKVVSDYGLRRKVSLPDPESYKPCIANSIAKKHLRHRHTFSAVGMRDRPGMTVAERYARRREAEWRESEKREKREQKEREEREREEREREEREREEREREERELEWKVEREKKEEIDRTQDSPSRSGSPGKELGDYPSPSATTDTRPDPCLRKRGKGKRKRPRSNGVPAAKPRKTRRSLPTPETTQSPVDSPGG